MSCIKVGSDESHLTVSLIVRSKVVRVSTDHNFWRERKAETESNRGPCTYQPNVLPLGQAGLHVEDRPNTLLPNESRVSVWLKRRSAFFSLSVPNTARILQTDELHPPANERPPFGLKGRKGQTLQGMATLVTKLNTSTFPFPLVLARSYGSQYIQVQPHEARMVLLNHTTETARVSVPLPSNYLLFKTHFIYRYICNESSHHLKLYCASYNVNYTHTHTRTLSDTHTQTDTNTLTASTKTTYVIKSIYYISTTVFNIKILTI